MHETRQGGGRRRRPALAAWAAGCTNARAAADAPSARPHRDATPAQPVSVGVVQQRDRPSRSTPSAPLPFTRGVHAKVSGELKAIYFEKDGGARRPGARADRSAALRHRAGAAQVSWRATRAQRASATRLQRYRDLIAKDAVRDNSRHPARVVQQLEGHGAGRTRPPWTRPGCSSRTHACWRDLRTRRAQAGGPRQRVNPTDATGLLASPRRSRLRSCSRCTRRRCPASATSCAAACRARRGARPRRTGIARRGGGEQRQRDRSHVPAREAQGLVYQRRQPAVRQPVGPCAAAARTRCPSALTCPPPRCNAAAGLRLRTEQRRHRPARARGSERERRRTSAPSRAACIQVTRW